MKFLFVKRILTPNNSIFFSLIRHNDEIIAFGRRHYMNGRFIQKVTLDEQFKIIQDDNIQFVGEDPRCFEHNNKIYVLDNYFNDLHLIDYESSTRVKINILGKNLSFVSHDNVLYFIHYIKPFELYQIDPATGHVTRIEVDDDKQSYNYEYRGGTPGYKLDDSTYYGFGHRTYSKDSIMKHDIFKWVLHFEPDKLPRISHFNVQQPEHSRNICDPTSVINVGGKSYLITAESDRPWFCEQDYITNVYEIV